MQAGFELKHRLVGALILLAVGIFGIPWLLERNAELPQPPANTAPANWQSIPLNPPFPTKQ